MSGKNIIIIGNGPAGVAAGTRLRQLNKSINITIFTNEEFSYYARPRLIDILAGTAQETQIILHNKDWYKKQNIDLVTNTIIENIDVKQKLFFTNQGQFEYDKLLLALGAEPNLPKITGIDLANIFTLRTISDAQKLNQAALHSKTITLLGGGLLSLEIANALCRPGRKINIIERSDHLLSRQLDLAKGKRLQKILEQRGMCFYLEETAGIINQDNKQLIIQTQKETKIISDIIIVCAGVNPRIALAKTAGLTTNKGIIVNKYLQTSQGDIYAAGDCIETEPKHWGFVKSAKEQGEIAAVNMLGIDQKEYNGTDIEVVLKVTGIDLKTL